MPDREGIRSSQITGVRTTIPVTCWLDGPGRELVGLVVEVWDEVGDIRAEHLTEPLTVQALQGLTLASTGADGTAWQRAVRGIFV